MTTEATLTAAELVIIPSEKPSQLTTKSPCGVKKLVQHRCHRLLLKACISENLDIVKRRLSMGTDNINCQFRNGRTPVMLAVKEKLVRLFQYLLELGCDLSALDHYKNNVLHLACISGHVGIVRKILDRRKCDIDKGGMYAQRPMMLAVYNNATEVFYLLVREGCNLTVVNEVKDNILHIACSMGNQGIIKYILSKDILDIESRGLLGMTPLLRSAWNDHSIVLALLLKKGCNPTAVDDRKNNILHIACNRGKVRTVTYLLTLAVVKDLVKAKNKYGRTPEQEADRKGHVRVVSLLKNK